MTVTRSLDATEQLRADWRDAQRVVDELRLDAPGRAGAEDRLHDIRANYLARSAAIEDAATAALGA